MKISGIVTGAIIGAAAIAGYTLQDKRMRKKIIRSGKRTVEKAGDILSNITDIR